jgi:small subunit ribosomal protein S20
MTTSSPMFRRSPRPRPPQQASRGEPLANHKSAEKRARQTIKRQERNRVVRGNVRTKVKAVRQAIEAGDGEIAVAKLRLAERAFRKAASKGVLKKATVSRSVSRLARAVHALSS